MKSGRETNQGGYGAKSMRNAVNNHTRMKNKELRAHIVLLLIYF